MKTTQSGLVAEEPNEASERKVSKVTAVSDEEMRRIVAEREDEPKPIFTIPVHGIVNGFEVLEVAETRTDLNGHAYQPLYARVMIEADGQKTTDNYHGFRRYPDGHTWCGQTSDFGRLMTLFQAKNLLELKTAILGTGVVIETVRREFKGQTTEKNLIREVLKPK